MSWSSVDCLALDPIDAACLLLSPSTRGFELRIDKDSKGFGAIRIPTFFDEKFESGDESPDLA